MIRIQNCIVLSRKKLDELIEDIEIPNVSAELITSLDDASKLKLIKEWQVYSEFLTPLFNGSARISSQEREKNQFNSAYNGTNGVELREMNAEERLAILLIDNNNTNHAKFHLNRLSAELKKRLGYNPASINHDHASYVLEVSEQYQEQPAWLSRIHMKRPRRFENLERLTFTEPPSEPRPDNVVQFIR